MAINISSGPYAAGAAIVEVTYGLSPEAVIVAPVGRVDEATWEKFGAHLSRGVEEAASQSRPTMIIDLSGIEYMSSRGLRALTVAKQEGVGAGVSVRLAAPNDIMREILAISRYDRLFAVDETVPFAEGGGA
ncbi:STAS domain-containing protein [Sphingomonas hankyongi]|uniref:STAS domain-containing protein n=1 Tax=Sphingomonas hankyongi TaxID=2908209 RepID=A0ABT0S1E0_9SPHN|nr:STAS domain-containing protein [Sphingomonas hankyongi]MCL6729669.1 STAS domain-containing protein [Sphingomonas hankyongi]